MDEEISSAVSYALNKGFQIHPNALEILHKINVSELSQIIKDVVKEKTKKNVIGFTGAPWTLLVYMLNKESPKKNLQKFSGKILCNIFYK